MVLITEMSHGEPLRRFLNCVELCNRWDVFLHIPKPLQHAVSAAGSLFSHVSSGHSPHSGRRNSSCGPNTQAFSPTTAAAGFHLPGQLSRFGSLPTAVQPLSRFGNLPTALSGGISAKAGSSPHTSHSQGDGVRQQPERPASATVAVGSFQVPGQPLPRLGSVATALSGGIWGSDGSHAVSSSSWGRDASNQHTTCTQDAVFKQQSEHPVNAKRPTKDRVTVEDCMLPITGDTLLDATLPALYTRQVRQFMGIHLGQAIGNDLGAGYGFGYCWHACHTGCRAPELSCIHTIRIPCHWQSLTKHITRP